MKHQLKTLLLLATVLLWLPRTALAQGTFSEFVQLIIQLMRATLPVIMTLALLALVWGAIKFIRASGGEERSEGRYVLFWGAIVLFIMVAVWGIVGLIVTTFFG